MSGKKFDVILMNPPYQKPSRDGIGRNKLLWPLFVEKALELCKEGGYIANIHPSIWRKPDYKLFQKLVKYNILRLCMNSKKAGNKVFGVNTRFDWYVLQKSPYVGPTLIIDEAGGKFSSDIRKFNFLPSANIEQVMKLMTTQPREQVEILYCTRYHRKYKELVKEEKTDKFCYPLVHSIVKNGPVLLYTNTTERGIFGIKNKVIINMGETLYSLLDLEGAYGMTECCFAIVCDSAEEAENVNRAINTKKFAQVVASTKWSNYKIEYKMFCYLRKDFWKLF